jgi:hypothetical protein
MRVLHLELVGRVGFSTSRKGSCFYAVALVIWKRWGWTIDDAINYSEGGRWVEFTLGPMGGRFN